ncbi:MAG: hypothetical protein ACR2O1_05900 [Boseongicola sp.]
MSTTIKRIVLAMPIVLIAWIGIMAGVMRFSDTAPAAVVPFPNATLLAALPSETGILGLSRFALTVANRPDMAHDLYEIGALLVLPAGLTGCLPLTKAQRDRLP